MIALLAAMLAPAAPAAAADPAPIPCFVEDTVYHAILDLTEREVRFYYGPYELVACPFTSPDDSEDVADFAHEWLSERRTLWQSVRERGVWAGKPAISDTVVNIISEVVKVEPDKIRRILPDRFRVEITGGFQILGVTPDGEAMDASFAESWSDFSGQLLSLGQLRKLTIEISPSDAQTLYYALEPGTPIIIQSEPPRGP